VPRFRFGGVSFGIGSYAGRNPMQRNGSTSRTTRFATVTFCVLRTGRIKANSMCWSGTTGEHMRGLAELAPPLMFRKQSDNAGSNVSMTYGFYLRRPCRGLELLNTSDRWFAPASGGLIFNIPPGLVSALTKISPRTFPGASQSFALPVSIDSCGFVKFVSRLRRQKKSKKSLPSVHAFTKPSEPQGKK
jgi:hypothetical protein